MRIVRITKDTNVAALRAQAAKAAPGQLEKLNPHLDLNRLGHNNSLEFWLVSSHITD